MGESRAFNKDSMPNYSVKIPQQHNFTDCGLYLLQYVEQFFKVNPQIHFMVPSTKSNEKIISIFPQDPIRDYRVPVMNKQLADWFDKTIVTRKREDISNLLKKLVDRHCPDNLPLLPDIPLPTLNGKLAQMVI